MIMATKQVIEALDNVDISILRHLQQDARLTIKEKSSGVCCRRDVRRRRESRRP